MITIDENIMRIFLCTILKSKHWAIKSISKGKRNKIKRDTKGYRCKILARRAPAREKRNILESVVFLSTNTKNPMSTNGTKMPYIQHRK